MLAALEPAEITVTQQVAVMPAHQRNATATATATATIRPRAQKQFGNNVKQTQAMRLRKRQAALHDGTLDHGDRHRVGIGIGKRTVLRFDIAGELLLDLILDGRENLPTCPLRQLYLSQVDALLRDDQDQWVRVLCCDLREFVLGARLPVDIGALFALVDTGPAKLSKLITVKLNQQARHQNRPRVRFSTIVLPSLSR